MQTFLQKLSSRKLWLAIAAFLGSIGGSGLGVATGNETLATVCAVCAALSAGIYIAAEAYVDGSNLKSKTTNITASTTSKDVVEALTKN